MSSRLKQSPDKIFDVFIEFVRDIGNGDEHGRVVKFFPRDFNDEEVLRPSVKFAFPYSCGTLRSEQEYFTFVMTDINSKFKFGFCKLVSYGDVERNYCVISCLPWFDSFYSLLDDLSSRLSMQDQEGASYMLSKLLESNPKGISQIISLTSPTSSEKFNFVCPIITSLASIPQNKNFSELFRSFRTANLMILFASILFERRILVFGSSVEKLTCCIHSLSQLIYPMCWQHLFIPILPPSLLDYCSAPMPYIIGLHTSTMVKLHKMEYSDAVLVNLDENKIHTEHADLAVIPHDVVVTLKKQLKLQKAFMEKNNIIGDGVARAFLTSMVSLIGGYRNAMRFHDGADITFDPDIFVAGSSFSRDPSSNLQYRRFYETVLHMQSFQQFINDRLDIMNAGKGFQDAFDQAVISMSGDEDKWKTQSRYKDWLSHMKKQGKILKREGRDKWTVFASKVRSKSKKTWKEIKSKLEDTKKEEPVFQSKSSGSVSLYKPPRPPPPAAATRDLRTTALLRSGMLRRSSLERTQHYHLLEIDVLDSKAPFSDSDDALNHLNQVDINLSDDPDLMSWMVRPPRCEVLSDVSWIKKSFSVEGLFSARDNEDAIFHSTLDMSISSSGKESLINARSYSSANVAAKRLDSLDISSMDSSFTDAPVREGQSGEKGSELFSGSKLMATSMICTSGNDSDSQKNLETNFCKLNRENWSHEDLMDFGSSNSSIEFDPLKAKDVSFIDNKPVPLPRNKSKNVDIRSLIVTVDGQHKIHDEVPLLPPLPLPRKRDSISIQYYHHRKQKLNLNNQAKLVKEDQSSQYNRNANSGTHKYLEDEQSLSTNTKLARSMFLQDCNIPISNSGLESFDPLASGQLIIEYPNKTPTPNVNQQKSDDELLKDWDLFDITKGVASVSFNAPSNCSGIDSNRLPGFYASPHVTTKHLYQISQPQSPTPFAAINSRHLKTQNLSPSPVYPPVIPRTHKSSTLPPWTAFQSNSNGSTSHSSRSESLWETFD